MNIKLVCGSLLIGLLGIGAAGCAADAASEENGDEVSNEEALKTSITPGEFKLYGKAHTTPSPSCDVYTDLKLSASPAKASLFETVGAGDPTMPHCKLMVQPHERAYTLKLTGTACGSKIYEGSRRAVVGPSATGLAKIKITDHRTRLCKDVVPAKIVVEETEPGFPGPITTTKYSYDGPTTGASITATGTMNHVMGIGGETTGYGFASDQGFFELVLDASEKAQFADGKKARVKGTTTLLSGVETHNRPAIEVSEILVCPAAKSINCMPPTTASLCKSDNRSWVEGNCPGVMYLD
jgi:hypothetical protein